MLIILIYDMYQLFVEKRHENTKLLVGLNLFSFLNLLLPTLTGTLVSMPRYALFSVSVFLRLARIKSLSAKIILLAVFCALHLMLFVFFLQGIFVG